MPRLPLPATDTSSETAAVYQAILGSRGQVPLLYRVLLNSPACALAWEAFLATVRRELSIPARLRELVILRIAVLNDAPYEFESHREPAEAAGLSATEIEAVRTGRADILTDTDNLVLAYTDAMTREIKVAPKLYRCVAEAFDAGQLVDLTVTIGAYNMVSRVLNALEIE